MSDFTSESRSSSNNFIVNSINWARILAQISYYFHSYASLRRSGKIEAGAKVRFVVPTGNFGDVLAGYFAKQMGLPTEKFVIATNSNDILDRFCKSGYYEKKPVHGHQANGGFPEDGSKAHEDGVKETLSPAMDILVSSNFERLLWFLAYQVYGKGTVAEKREIAGLKVKGWLDELKTNGGFGVEPALLDAAKAEFVSQRVSDEETLNAIASVYSRKSPAATSEASSGTSGTAKHGKYILDPHSAIGVHAAYKSLENIPDVPHIALATAHPAKFSNAVEKALKHEQEFKFDDLLPEQLRGREQSQRRMTLISKDAGLEGLRREIRARVPASGL